jgi:hypothetical protein
MGILDKIKTQPRPTAPASQANQHTPAQAFGNKAKEAPPPPPSVLFATTKLNETQVTQRRQKLNKAKGRHLLKIIKPAYGVMGSHAKNAGAPWYAVDFEVVESNTLPVGEERSWQTVKRGYDYFEKDTKGFFLSVVGPDNAGADFDALLVESLGQENPLGGQLVIADCVPRQGADIDPDTGEPYLDVFFSFVPPSEGEQAA